MYIKFGLNNKKIFGTVVQLHGDRTPYKDATINIDIKEIVKMEVIHTSNDNKHTDVVELLDGCIRIPFKKSDVNVGVNSFMLKAYMADGTIQTSQTCIHEVSENIYNDMTTSYFKTMEFSEYTIDDIRVYPITVDMDSIESIETSIKFKQFDFGSCYILMQLMDNNVPLKLNNISVVATFKNPVNDVLLDTVTYDASQILVSSIDGIVKLLVPNQALRYVGTVECEVMIFNTEQKRSTTPSISFKVIKSIVNHEEYTDFVEDDRYSILTTLLNTVGALHTTTEGLIASTTLLKTETEAVKNATIVVKDATEVVKNDTLAIKQATETVKNETLTVKQTTEQVKNDTLIVKNDTLTVKNDTIAAKNNAVNATDAAKAKIVDVENRMTTIQSNANSVIAASNTVKQETEAVKNATEIVKNETIVVRDNATAKIIDVENRMVTIENQFGDLVDGTGFASKDYVDSSIITLDSKILTKASKDYVDSSIITLDSKILTKANKDETYTKSEVDTIINSKTQINDSNITTTTVWSSSKTYNEIQATIDDNLISTTHVWSSKKTKDMIDANSPTMPDGSSMIDSIIANESSILSLQNEVSNQRIKGIQLANSLLDVIV